MRPHHNDLGQVWKLDKVESEIIPPNIRSRDLHTYDLWLVVYLKNVIQKMVVVTFIFHIKLFTKYACKVYIKYVKQKQFIMCLFFSGSQSAKKYSNSVTKRAEDQQLGRWSRQNPHQWPQLVPIHWKCASWSDIRKFQTVRKYLQQKKKAFFSITCF